MLNEDLIAFLEPAPSRFNPFEWRDACQEIGEIEATPSRLRFRVALPPGLYKGRIETRPGAFEMKSAMVEMFRAPDGARVPLGPWDLDHMDEVMGMPMVRVFVNGRLKGGLWFDMPGPEQIAENRLSAEYGFEAEAREGEEETEVVFEFIERDRSRISWQGIRYLDLRRDDRRQIPLLPMEGGRPPLYCDLQGRSLEEYRRIMAAKPEFQAIRERLRVEEAALWTGRFGATNVFDLACLVAFFGEDREGKALGELAKQGLLELCRNPQWGQRADPLIMGGENDRGLGHALYVAGMGWEYLKPLLSGEERELVLRRAEEKLQAIYDFTLLQRGYMGCPTADEHSTGAWFGVGVACMSFYEALPIARKALPFFHGLFIESLSLFPPGGKAKWATFCPLWLARYFAAAVTFSGSVPELAGSRYLDNLARGLVGSLVAPNSQELQRGVRTVNDRVVLAFLSRFHRVPEIDAIYWGFAEEERRLAGDVRTGMFDFLYAPEPTPPASFRPEPLFTRDIGQVVSVLGGEKTISVLLRGGAEGGSRENFRKQPHNREELRSLGDIEVRVDETPVITRIQSAYGLYGANFNTLHFEEGAYVAEGQYLHGDIAPEKNAFIRRCLVDDRFIYTDVNLTGSLKPALGVRRAQRTILQDRSTGVLVIMDAFAAQRPLRVSTHLHCSGSVRPVSGEVHSITGGQANRIAGVKGGSAGLSDEEGGEIFARVLECSAPSCVKVEEPFWFPSYIHGINGNKEQTFGEAVFPKLQRWRLEARERIAEGIFLFALTPDPALVTMPEGVKGVIEIAGTAKYFLKGAKELVETQGWTLRAEAVVSDTSTGRVLALGATTAHAAGREMAFTLPVDLTINPDGSGVIHSVAAKPVSAVKGIGVGTFRRVPDHPRSSATWEASFASA